MSFLTKLPRKHYSADAFVGFRDNLEEFAPGVARALAWMCQLAYETDEPIKVREIAAEWGLGISQQGIISEEIVTPLPKASTQAIVANSNGATIIAFAGTDPLVVADWITDFDIVIMEAGSANGFTVAATVIWPQLQKLLATLPKTSPVFVTGHSLGGALAVLIAQKIDAENLGLIRSVYTFGMPRAGNVDFANAYDRALGNRTFRMVHADDIVPTVAPSSLGFRHVGRYIRCRRGGPFYARDVPTNPGSDEPQFSKHLLHELRALLLGRLSHVLSITERLKLVTALTLGIGPAGMRTDPGGLLIELLPPPLRDHMPDRYIGASAAHAT